MSFISIPERGRHQTQSLLLQSSWEKVESRAGRSRKTIQPLTNKPVELGAFVFVAVMVETYHTVARRGSEGLDGPNTRLRV